jgi:tetratricopeptide (TPR) repeat protein
MLQKSFIAMVGVAVLGMSLAARAESLVDLLQKGIYTEQTVGDLEGAIKIYGQIVANAEASRPCVSNAQYRLGMCYLRKGEKAKAAEAFKRVLAKYADQKEVFAQAESELGKLARTWGGPPVVLNSHPAAFANDVPPSLKEITVTFDRPMKDQSWSWTGGGETFPKTTGKPHYDEAKMTCSLPVKLEPGKAYWVGVNAKDFKNFKSADGKPAKWYVILFATASADGQPTPIPEQMLTQAKEINAAAKEAAREPPPAGPEPVVVKTTPTAFANDVDPSLKEITVTFDRRMKDQSWSWTGGGDTYPKTTGRPHYDAACRTCTLPVELQPGKVYWVGVNAKSFKNFQTPDFVPAKWYVILFATRSADGKPTVIPQDMLKQAKEINAAAREAASLPPDAGPQPVVVATSPPVFATDVSPSLKEITVTFDRRMKDGSWSWTSEGDTFPKTTGRPYYEERCRTCTLPVELQPGKAYLVGINAPRFRNFQTPDFVPARQYIIVFATRESDGRATPLPLSMLAEAAIVNFVSTHGVKGGDHHRTQASVEAVSRPG